MERKLDKRGKSEALKRSMNTYSWWCLDVFSRWWAERVSVLGRSTMDGKVKIKLTGLTWQRINLTGCIEALKGDSVCGEWRGMTMCRILAGSEDRRGTARLAEWRGGLVCITVFSYIDHKLKRDSASHSVTTSFSPPHTYIPSEVFSGTPEPGN